jgi:RNA polymerase sigma factor (sigma-70 family)
MTAIDFNLQITSLRKNLEFFALSLTNNSDDAQDLLQETYLKALTYREKYADDTNLKAWLFTIMKNTFINSYRRKVKSNTILDISEDLYYLNNSVDANDETPDSELFTKEIEKGIAELEEEYKTPFLMHTQGFKYKEIAEDLDLSIGTVKSRIFFTRKKLMKRLSDYQN